MPRIRTLKPEHKAHRKVGMLSDRQYRLWVGLITEADDDGRLVVDAAWLRAVVFPYQPRLSVRAVAEALQELATVGLIDIYTLGNTRYGALGSWRDHQRLDRAHYTPSRLPPPPVGQVIGKPPFSSPSVDAPESTARIPADARASRRSQGSEGNLTTKDRKDLGGSPGTPNGSHEPGSGETNGTDPTPADRVCAVAMKITPEVARTRRLEAAARAPKAEPPDPAPSAPPETPAW